MDPVNKHEASAQDNPERMVLKEVKWLVDLALFSGLPMIVLFVIIGYLSDSITIYTSAAAFLLGLLVRFFAFKSMREILRSDTVKFPYGTGKLENFSSLLYGALVIPSSIVLIILSVKRMAIPDTTIDFSIALIPVFLSLLRNLYLTWLSGKIRKKTTSELVRSYFINYRISSLYDSGVLISVTVSGILVNSGNHVLPSYIDATVSMLVSVYALIMGLRLTTDNFKVLIDLPLCEEDQMYILRVLAAHYDRFEMIGNIYTRRSGVERIIEIELFLKGHVSVAEIKKLSNDMRQMLEVRFGSVRFNILPLQWDTQREKHIPNENTGHNL